MSGPPFNCPVLILAAGQSRRMGGRDKLLEEIDGVPLITRLARAALATGQPVLVTLPPQGSARRAALQGEPVRIVTADLAADGMAASLVAGLAALPERADAVMILLGDLPEIGADDLRAVMAAAASAPQAIWRGATDDGRPGHPVVFPRRLFSELAGLQGDSGAQTVIQAHAGDLRLCSLPGARAVTDLDTPEAWAAWRAKQARR